VADLRVKGGNELQRMLGTLPANVERSYMRGALRAGAKVLQGIAQSRVSVVSGELRDAIVVKVSARRGRITARIMVEMKDNRPIWVEYGTKKHVIRADASKRPQRMTRRGMRAWSVVTINRSIARGSLVIGGVFIGEMVRHPGAQPHPYMRPAMDSGAAPALMAVGNYLKARLARGKDGIKAARNVNVEVSE
jgi:hypothetical protein